MGWIWRDNRGRQAPEGGGKRRGAGRGKMERAREGGANQRIEQNNEIESLVVAAHTFHA